MSAITFAFDQGEIEELINSAPASQNILVSILSAKAKDNPKSNLFLAAQLSDASSNAAFIQPNSAPKAGCPFPPAWKHPGALEHEKLVGLPKFVIPFAERNKLLANKATGDMLFADLEAADTGGGLQTRLSFKIKDANNEIIDTVIGEVL